MLPPPHVNGAPNVQKPLGSSAPFNSTVSDAELQLLEPSLASAGSPDDIQTGDGVGVERGRR